MPHRRRIGKTSTVRIFDFIGTFIEAAHARNMIIFAGMNIFADGQNIVKRGAIFDKHKKWQAINYVPRKGLLL